MHKFFGVSRPSEPHVFRPLDQPPVGLATLLTALASEPDASGILQGVRPMRQGVPYKRICLYPSVKNGPGCRRGTAPGDLPIPISYAIACEGRLETKFAERIELDAAVKRYRAQPFAMPGPNGRPVYPDFVVEHRNGRIEVVDVKPAGALLDRDVSVRMRWVKWHLALAGIPHRVVTDSSLHSEPEATNRRRLSAGLRIYSHEGIAVTAARLLKNGPMRVEQLRDAMVAEGLPALSPEKLVIDGHLDFDRQTYWTSTTLLRTHQWNR